MKITNFTNLLFGFGLGFISALSQPSYAAGEAQGNPLNDCNTSSGECTTTPTKFSTTVYRVALCTSSPMLPSTTVDWDGAGCADVYNNPNGEETAYIFIRIYVIGAIYLNSRQVRIQKLLH